MQSFVTYPTELLARLRKGKHLKARLSAEIQHVLDNDQEVITLIGGRSNYEALSTDPMVRSLVIDKTFAVYDRLVDEGRKDNGGDA